MKNKLKTPQVSYTDMPFIDTVYGYSMRDDIEVLYIGATFDNLLTAKYSMEQLGEEDDQELYSAYLTVMKSILTEKEYEGMVEYLENGYF